MSKRFTDTDKYDKPFFRGLQGPYKLLWDYLYHECNHAGFWTVDFEVAQIKIGRDMTVNPTDAIKFFNTGEERVTVLKNGLKWFVRPFIEFQYNVAIEDLNPENRVHLSVMSALKKEGLWKGLTRGLQGPMDKDKEKDKDKDKERPSLEMVSAYCRERGNSVDPEKWLSFYQSNGWRVGKNPMKNWQAAVRTWEKSEFNQPPKTDRHDENWIEKISREAQEKAAQKANA